MTMQSCVIVQPRPIVAGSARGRRLVSRGISIAVCGAAP
jgi:hypothetical protein